MRRQEREIADQSQIEEVIARAEVCHLALIDGDWPYIVPMSYGYRDGVLYLHSAPAGLKIELLRRNPQVCFEMEADVALLPGESACGFGMRYRSVVGRGVARLVLEREAKVAALDVIMAHYGATGPHDYDSAMLARTLVIAIEVVSMTGKQAHVA